MKREHTITYVIEHLCGNGAGCSEHAPGTWRKARNLADGISQDYAEVLFERHCEQHPKSTYRLVEVEEIHTITERILS